MWDILSGKILCNLELKRPIVSLDISPEGDMLATSFANSREIQLWHNLIDSVPGNEERKQKLVFATETRDAPQALRARL